MGRGTDRDGRCAIGGTHIFFPLSSLPPIYALPHHVYILFPPPPFSLLPFRAALLLLPALLLPPLSLCYGLAPLPLPFLI